MATSRKGENNRKDSIHSSQKTKGAKNSKSHQQDSPLHKNDLYGILEGDENNRHSEIPLSFWSRV